MPGRSDPAGAPRRRLPGGRRLAPGQVGLGVVALAATLAAVVALTGAGQAYWLCVPAALAAAALCDRPLTAALAAATVMAGAGAGTFAAPDTAGRPALWVALAAPLGSVAVLGAVRSSLERDPQRDFALTDPLTGAANRRALLTRAEHEVARHLRADRPFAVVMLDLDGFKTLNDRFGHTAGDDLLREVAVALVRAMRAQDMVARIGGDEFCVLAPETDGEGAVRLAERVARAVSEVTAGIHSVCGSVGAAVFPDDALAPAQLIDVADERLLAAKRVLYRDRSARRAA
jgi:diguanylate cyclase (GGDEF)-like protein